MTIMITLECTPMPDSHLQALYNNNNYNYYYYYYYYYYVL